MTTKIKFVFWVFCFGFHISTTISSKVDNNINEDQDLNADNANHIRGGIVQVRQQIYEVAEKLNNFDVKMCTDAKIESVMSKAVDLNTKMSVMEEILMKVEPILINWEEKLNSKIENLKLYINNIIDDKIGQLEKQLVDIKPTIESLEVKIANVETHVDDIKTKVGTINTEVETITEKIGVLDENVISLETNITRHTAAEIELLNTTLNVLFAPPNCSEREDYNPNAEELASMSVLELQLLGEKRFNASSREILSCYEGNRVFNISNDGVYETFPFHNGTFIGKSIKAYCDMTSDGGGWTVFQRRGIPGHLTNNDRYELFKKFWIKYRNGFGNPEGDYWIGLDTIYQLTKDCKHELLITATDVDGTSYQALYSTFSVSSEKDNFKLLVGGYNKANSTLKDWLTWHNGASFSTMDRDNDSFEGHCSEMHKGNGFWFKNCFYVSLNGMYTSNRHPETLSTSVPRGILWYSDGWLKLKRTEMKIRPSC